MLSHERAQQREGEKFLLFDIRLWHVHGHKASANRKHLKWSLERSKVQQVSIQAQPAFFKDKENPTVQEVMKSNRTSNEKGESKTWSKASHQHNKYPWFKSTRESIYPGDVVVSIVGLLAARCLLPGLSPFLNNRPRSN